MVTDVDRRAGSPTPTQRSGFAAIAVGLLIASVVAVVLWWPTDRPRVPTDGTAQPDPSEFPAPSDPTTHIERTDVGSVLEPPTSPASSASTRVRGRVVDAESNAIDGAVVRIRLALFANVDAELGAIAERRATPDGRFEIPIEAISAGALVLVVTAPGHSTTSIDDVAPVAGDLTDLGDIVLARSGTLRGVVVDASGATCDGATIVSRLDAAPGAAESVIGTSGADGAFAIADLAPGVFEIAAWHERGASNWTGPLRVEPGATRDGVVLSLASGVTLEGQVIDAETRRGLAATVRCSPERDAPRRTIATDDDGRFAIRGLPLAGTMHLEARRDGFVSVGGDATVSLPSIGASVPAPVLVLAPRRPAAFRVVDAQHGTPIVGATLRSHRFVRDVGAARIANPAVGWSGPVLATTDADGRAASSIPEVAEAIVATAEGFAPSVLAVPDAANPTELRFELNRGVRLDVHVRGITDASAPTLVELRRGTTVRRRWRQLPLAIGDPARPWIARASVDAGGRASFVGLTADEYFVSARGADACSNAVERFIDADATIELELDAPATLAGRVTSDGRPDVGHAVFVVDAFQRVARTRTESDGTFLLRGLVPGPVRVVATRTSRSPLDPIHLDRAVQVVLVTGTTTTVDLAAEPPAASIRGNVRWNGQPAAGVRVDVVTEPADRPARSIASTWSDVDGAFELPSVTAGAFTLVAHDPNGAQQVLLARVPIRIEPTTPAPTLDLVGGSVRALGRLRATGEPAAWADLTWTPDPDAGGVPGFPNATDWSVRLGGFGTATIERMPAGAYRIEARLPSGARATARIRIDASDAATVELVFE